MDYCRASDCLGVELWSDEEFCPWCGRLRTYHTVQYQVKKDSNWVNVDSPLLAGDKLSLRLAVSCRPGGKPVVIRPNDIQSRVPWLTVTQPSATQTLASGQTLYCDVVLGRPEFAVGNISGVEGSVAVKCEAGDTQSDGGAVLASLIILPKPDFRIALAKESLVFDVGHKTDIVIPFEVALASGVATITGISCTVGDCSVGALSVRLPQLMGAVSGGARVAKGQLCIPSKLFETAVGEKRFDISIDYRFSHNGAVRTDIEVLPVRILFRGRPQLQLLPFDDEHFMQWKIVSGASVGYAFDLEMSNNGDTGSELVVNRMLFTNVEDCTATDGSRRTLNWQPLAINWERPLPVTLKQNEVLKGTAAVSRDLPVGQYSIGIDFQANELAARSDSKRSFFVLNVGVSAPQTYDGLLAVDFGSTGSCAAIAGTGCPDPMLIIIDPTNKGDTNYLRSVIEYRRYDPNDYDKCQANVGYYAWQGYFDRPYATVLGPKRYLGSTKKTFDVTPVNDSRKLTCYLKPSEVAGHLYHRLVSAVKEAVVTGKVPGVSPTACQITNFVITHPSLFAPSQLRLLRQAAYEAFAKAFNCKPAIKLIQEPVAAAMAYLNREDTHAFWHDKRNSDHVEYSVVVYDCGGGTTDLTLLKVVSERSTATRSELRPVMFDDVVAEPAGRFRDYVASALAVLLKASSQPKAMSSWLDKLTNNDKWCSGLSNDWQDYAEAPFTFDMLSDEILAQAQNAYDRAGYHYEVKVTLVGASGDSSFGGEDMTESVRCLLLEKAREKLAAAKPGAQILDSVQENEAESAKLRAVARNNMRSLYYWAEIDKIGLSDSVLAGREDYKLPDSIQPGSPVEALTNLKLYTPPQSGGQAKFEEMHLLDLLKGDSPSYYEVKRALQKKIVSTVKSLRSLADEGLKDDPVKIPDVLLLTGRASRWPQVRDVLSSYFPEPQQDKPGTIVESSAVNLKQCVVDGAARWARSVGAVNQKAGVTVTVINDAAFTTSRLGLLNGTEFLDIIPAGRQLVGNRAEGSVDYLVPCAGKHLVKVYESSGGEELSSSSSRLDSAPELVGVFEYDIPAGRTPEQLKGQMVFALQQNEQMQRVLEVTLRLGSGANVWANTVNKNLDSTGVEAVGGNSNER